MSSPLQMALGECANFVAEGCIFADGENHPEGVCGLAKRGTRCGYFEKAVLPLAERIPKYSGVPKQYWRSVATRAGKPVAAITARTTGDRLCECGAPREAGHTYCPACAKRRKHELDRGRTRKRREKQLACHAFVGF